MDKVEKTEKKAYSRPAMVRVKLNGRPGVGSEASTAESSVLIGP